MCDDMQQGQGAHRSGQDPNMQISSPSMTPSSLLVQLLCHILYDTRSAGALAAQRREGDTMPKR